MSKPRLFISFSGGRTSALMVVLLVEFFRGVADIRVVFANTGQEDELTLIFVDRCDREFNLDVVWVEALVHPQMGVGTTHRVVDFESACRDERLFESMVRKFGISNPSYPHCTRELKLRPLTSYARSIGWGAGTYTTAIGLRADEIDRVNPKYKEENLWYPLIDKGVRKEDVLRFWDNMHFDLEIPEHLGNCTWCWKKSLRKHLTLARDFPHIFDVPRKLETLYPNAGSGSGGRVFFRSKRSAADLLELAKQPFEEFLDARYLDMSGGCSESCEIFDDTTDGDIFA